MSALRKNTIIAVAVGSIINFVLAITKLYIGLRTNSISVFSDAINNFFDIVTCFIAIAAFGVMQKKSKRYPFGAARAEYVAAFVVAVVVCAIGINFIYSAITRFLMPVPVWFSWLYFGILSATAVVKLIMAQLYRKVNIKAKSDILKALMLDSYIDSAITTTIVIGFVLMSYSGLRVDSIFGIVTGAVILASGIKLMVYNIDLLIGKGATCEQLKEIEGIFEEYPKIRLVKFALHSYGRDNNYGIAEVRYEPMFTVEEVEELNAQIENRVKEKLGFEIKISFGR